MRLVRFEDESGGFAVDLHPLITVISGLPAHVRERLVYGLAALPRGGDPGGRGSLEVHGVFLDLNRESLELLELNQDLDVVLRAADLPGAENVGDSSLGIDDLYDDQPSEFDDEELMESRRLVDEFEELYETAVHSTELLRRQLVEVEGEQAVLNQQLAEARTGLDSFAVAGVKIAREELAELTAASGGATAEPDDDAVALNQEDRDRIEARLTVLIDEADRLRRMVKSLKAIDPAPVREAFAELEQANAATMIPSEEAEELIAEWQELIERHREANERRSGTRAHLIELTSRRDRAYDEYVEAERGLQAPELDPELVDRLETIHDEIFELDGRSSKLNAAKIRRRMEYLRAQENEVLRQLGFDTWSSYVMGITIGGADPNRHLRFDAARAEYEFAEDELAAAASAPEVVDPELGAIEGFIADVRKRAAALLGRDAGLDPVPALRALRVPLVVAEPSAESDDAMLRLRAALEATGAEMPGRSMTAVELKSIAAGWLEAMASLEDRQVEVEAERLHVENEISELAVQLDELGPDHVTLPRFPVADPPELLEARHRVEESEQRVRRHEEAVARIASIEARHERLDERVRELRSSLGERDERVGNLNDQRVAARNRLRRAESSREAVTASRREVRRQPVVESGRMVGGSAGAEAVEWYVLARLAQQRSVSFVGSVPLVIDDAFVNWPMEALHDVFTRLERMGEVIQIVYLTDDETVGDWARSLGADKALVLDMRVPTP